MLETNKLLKITKVALIIMTVVSVLFAIMGVASADVWDPPSSTESSLSKSTQS